MSESPSWTQRFLFQTGTETSFFRIRLDGIVAGGGPCLARPEDWVPGLGGWTWGTHGLGLIQMPEMRGIRHFSTEFKTVR